MRHLRLTLGTIAVTACVIGGMAASSAGAHEFSATAMGLLTLKPVTTAKITSFEGRWECPTQRLGAGEAVLSSKTLLVTVQYSKCTGLGSMFEAQYELSAEGSVSLPRTVTRKSAGCEVKWPSAKNQHLGTVKYKQTGKAVEMAWALTHMTSEGVGAGCAYAEESAGVFEDTWLLDFASGGGSVEWK